MESTDASLHTYVSKIKRRHETILVLTSFVPEISMHPSRQKQKKSTGKEHQIKQGVPRSLERTSQFRLNKGVPRSLDDSNQLQSAEMVNDLQNYWIPVVHETPGNPIVQTRLIRTEQALASDHFPSRLESGGGELGRRGPAGSASDE